MSRWRSLPVRLGGFFAVVITATLLLFSASIYMVAQLTEQDEDDEYEYTERELAEEREHLLTTIAIALPAALAAAIGGGRAGGAAGSQLKAPMPGRVVRVLVAAGHTVERGAAVMIVEAMKMENELRAPAAGTVLRVHVGEGAAVDSGQLLVELELA